MNGEGAARRNERAGASTRRAKVNAWRTRMIERGDERLKTEMIEGRVCLSVRTRKEKKEGKRDE
jgi:hypothetical protein